MKQRKVEAVVFCGGKSRRMGADKAELPAPDGSGRTLLESAIAALQPVAERVFLATGDSPRYEALGLDCVLDVESGAGPLAALSAALEASEAEWLCVLACDMPLVSAEVFEQLLERAESQQLDLCLLEAEQGVEPLCAVYRTSCAPAVRRALARGERRMVAFHGDDLRLGTLKAENFDAAGSCTENLNTRADYARVMNPEQPSDSAGESS